jgi:type I restriction enzyme S subunit
VLNGFAFQSKKYVDNGIKVIRITNVQKGSVVDNDPQYYPLESLPEIKDYMLSAGDLLLSLTGNVGRVGLLPPSMCPAALNQRVACLRFNESIVNRTFIFATLNMDFFEQACIASATGTAQKNMSTEWLKRYRILLPPMDVQNTFATFVEQSDKSKFELQKALDELTAMQKKLMLNIFSEQ